MTDYSYIGVGKVSIRVAGSSAPLRHIGNVSALSFDVTEDVKELKDYTQAGGGTYNEVRRVSSVEASMTLHDLSPENLGVVLFGDVNAIVAGSVSNEAHTIYLGGLVKTTYPINTASSVTVTAGDDAVTRANSTAYNLGDYIVPATPNDYYYKVTTAGTTAGSPPTFGTTVGGTTTDGTATLTCMGKTTLVANTDYSVTAGGIYIESDAAATDGEAIEVDYTKAAGSEVEALLNSAQEYEIVFDGLNEARSGKAVIVHVFRQKIGAAQNLGLIGEDYAALEVSGKVLKDTTKNGTTVSQYFKVQVVA
jgi:hypothetical protein